MSNSYMNLMEQKRFKNQIDLPFIGEEGQLKLKNAKVVVVGAGGKGISVLKQLAAGGIGTIGICDNALVDEMELSRQNMYGLMDLGKQRAIVVKQYLEKMNHTSNLQIHNLFVDESNATNICSSYDVIVDATNNWKSKINILSKVNQAKSPLVTGYIDNQHGEISVLSKSNSSGLLNYYSKRIEELPNQNGNTTFGVPVILISIVGSVMANEVFRVLLDIPSPVDGKLLNLSLDNYEFSISNY